MTPESFCKLHRRVENDPIFQNNSYNPQAPSEYQLLLTLRRLGMGGNGVSVGQMSQVFLVSGKLLNATNGHECKDRKLTLNLLREIDGTVELWTLRCVAALCRNLVDLLFWPNSRELLNNMQLD